MDKDMFKERGHSLEEDYFRKHEAKLIAKLRERGRLEDIAEELAIKLRIDKPGLLHRIMALGVTLDTAPAFLLAPLVQVAWGEGAVTDRERATVLRLAEERGVAKDSRAHAQLEAWMRERPENALFDAAIEAIKTFKPELVMLDWMMPGMDGPTLFRKMKELPEVSGLPVVFITAKASQAELDELRALGAAGTISKPFSPRDLPEQLRAIWSKLP